LISLWTPNLFMNEHMSLLSRPRSWYKFMGSLTHTSCTRNKISLYSPFCQNSEASNKNPSIPLRRHSSVAMRQSHIVSGLHPLFVCCLMYVRGARGLAMGVPATGLRVHSCPPPVPLVREHRGCRLYSATVRFLGDSSA